MLTAFCYSSFCCSVASTSMSDTESIVCFTLLAVVLICSNVIKSRTAYTISAAPMNRTILSVRLADFVMATMPKIIVITDRSIVNQPDILKVIIERIAAAISTRPEVSINIPSTTTINEIIARYLTHITIPATRDRQPSTRLGFCSRLTINDTTEIIPIVINEIPIIKEIYSIHFDGNAINSTPITAETIIVAMENRFNPLKNSIINYSFTELSAITF